MLAEIGANVEVIIKDYEPYLPTGRRETTQTLSGVVVATPKWMANLADLTLINSVTKAHNYIPKHKIVSIGGVKITQPKVTADKVFQVASSKTGELYTVRQDGRTKRWSCTCIGFQFHKKCRHAIRAAEAA
jgi:outer membrane protein assembly factor BamB